MIVVGNVCSGRWHDLCGKTRVGSVQKWDTPTSVDNTTQHMIPLKDYLAVLLPDTQPWTYITAEQHKLITGDTDWQPNGPFVVENADYTIGMNGLQLVPCANGNHRIWHRADWELCDNKRRSTVARIEAAQQAKKDLRNKMVSAIRKQMVDAGVMGQLVDTLMSSQTDGQVESMYNMLPPQYKV